MHTTPASLLEQLRRPGDQGSWARFVRLYYPLIYHWARRSGASPEDAGDLVQEVLMILIRTMPSFEYDPSRSFRGWLRTVTLNAWRKRMKSPSLPTDLVEVDGMIDPSIPATEEFEEAEYRRHLVVRALRLMEKDFRPTTWRACWENVAQGHPAEDVARELGITVNSVYLAKSRVLRRLRQELDGLLD